MLQIEAFSFLSSLTLLANAAGDFKAVSQIIELTPGVAPSRPGEQRGLLLQALDSLMKECQQLELMMAARACGRARAQVISLFASSAPFSAVQYHQLASVLENAIIVVVEEAQRRKFFATAERADMFVVPPEESFGQSVVDAFPEAAIDIGEAGRCLAFELWTASVMHVMRVLEIGLTALAQHMGVESSQNWNQTLNTIELRLREVRRGTHGEEAEHWAAEAGTHFRFVKGAWRNRAMHPLERYDEQSARRIFENARDFMQHLAERV